VFRRHARKLVLAVSLFAVATSLVPGSHTAAAAPIPAAESASAVRYDLVPTKPGHDIAEAYPKMSVLNTLVGRNGRKTTYHFKVQADNATLHNVSVRMFSSYRAISDNADRGYSADEVVSLGTFWAPDYRPVILTCNPPSGAYYSAGLVEATTSSGLHTWGANDADGNKS
jgi:hypothetical protein